MKRRRVLLLFVSMYVLDSGGEDEQMSLEMLKSNPPADVTVRGGVWAYACPPRVQVAARMTTTLHRKVNLCVRWARVVGLQA